MKKLLVALVVLLAAGFAHADTPLIGGGSQPSVNVNVMQAINFQAQNTVSANYTTTSTDTVILASAAAGGITITLNAVSNETTGHALIIIKADQTTNAVTIKANSADVIQGTGTLVLNAYTQSDQIMSNGQVNGKGLWGTWGQGIQATPPYIRNNYGGSASVTVGISSAIYLSPMCTSVPIVVSSMVVTVGGTANTTIDTCIYDTSGVLIKDAGVVNMGAAGKQVLGFTPVLLPAGCYYGGVQMSNTASTMNGTNATSNIPTVYINVTPTAMGCPASLTLQATATTHNIDLYVLPWGGVQN